MKYIVKSFALIKILVWNIFELSEKSNKKQSRFEYLDGYRGSLAIIVAISHTIPNLEKQSDIWRSTIGYSLTYGVAGFFMLSAFLLTFRLLEELDNTQNRQLIIVIIIKYFIRRFFRIYLVYILFVTAIKFGPKKLSEHDVLVYNSPYLLMVILGNTGLNHLWTIPAEIRYYFIIPLFCLIVHYLCRFLRWIFLIACVIWTIYDQKFNFFCLTVEQIKIQFEGSHYLYVHFAVFFMGSQVALAYHLISNLKWTKSFFKNYFIRFCLDWISLSVALIGLYKYWMVYYDSFTFRSRPTVYWSISLLLTLLSAPNSLSKFFNLSSILKSVGKYSFSFYLIHTSVAYWVRKYYFYYSPLNMFLIFLSITYVISFFSFYLIENPLIRFANYLCEKLDKFCNCYKYERIDNHLDKIDNASF